MHAKNLLVDDGSDGKAVEAIGESLPKFDVVPSLALIIEAVDSVDRCALVVASEQEEVLRVLDLVGEEEANGLERLLSSVNVISKEEIVGLRGETAILEESQEVIILAMHITADFDWGLKLKENGLVDEDVSRFDAESFDLLLCELHLLAWSGSSNVQKLVNNCVDVYFLFVHAGCFENIYKNPNQMWLSKCSIVCRQLPF